MSVRTHRLSRADLPENAVVAFEAAGCHYVVAEVEGEVRAFAVTGPAVRALGRAALADGRLCCPLHGWPIDPEAGRCGAAEFCQYRPVAVEVDDEEIRVTLRDS